MPTKTSVTIVFSSSVENPELHTWELLCARADAYIRVVMKKRHTQQNDVGQVKWGELPKQLTDGN